MGNFALNLLSHHNRTVLGCSDKLEAISQPKNQVSFSLIWLPKIGMGKENVEHGKSRERGNFRRFTGNKIFQKCVVFEKREVERDEIREFSRSEFMWVHITIFRSLGLFLKVIASH